MLGLGEGYEHRPRLLILRGGFQLVLVNLFEVITRYNIPDRTLVVCFDHAEEYTLLVLVDVLNLPFPHPLITLPLSRAHS
jgi:hypothetical protein